MRGPFAALLFLLVTSACKPAEGPPGAKDRPFTIRVPSRWDERKPIPVVFSFHDYGESGATQAKLVDLEELAERELVLLITPDGRVDAKGKRFWEATDACCSFGGATPKRPDDLAYFDIMLKDVKARYAVDPKRVFVIGFSNGAFMAERLACERSEEIAGIVSMAGATFKEHTRCAPKAHLAVLEVHGDSDEVVPYNGGSLTALSATAPPFPSAHDTASAWAERFGCEAVSDRSAPPLDIDQKLPGPETSVERWGGCKGGVIELWTITGGKHVPSPSRSFALSVWKFLMAHPRP